ncbi:MAG: DUF3667 domain-containing protein [Flavobacteriales bacterium]
MAHVCLNCGHKYAGNFCNECGQKAKVKRLDWHYLVHEIPHSIFHIDKGFFFTLKEMLKHPGVVIQEYLNGKRAKYFPPLTYLFILGTIAGLVYLRIPFVELSGNDAPGKAFVEKFLHLFGKNYNFVTLASIPLFGLITWLFYKKERNFVEITTAHFFIFGTINLMMLISAVALFHPPQWLLSITNILSTLLMLGYQVWCYSTMFVTRSRTRRIWYGILISIICSIIALLLTFGLVIVYLLVMMKENPELIPINK